MFRFSVRDLLWLVVVVALSLGWSLDHRQLAIDREIISQQLSQSVLEVQKCDRQILGLEGGHRVLATTQNQLMSFLQRKQSWTMNDLKAAIADAVSEAEDKHDRGLR